MGEIFLGNIVQQNGRNTATGIASGLDSASLIEGILSARQSTIDSQQDVITSNNEKIDAYAELEQLLDRFRTSVDFLRNPPGVNNEADNYFEYRTSSLTTSDSNTGASYLNVSALPGAQIDNYEITNIVTANRQILSLDNFTSKTASVVSDLNISDRFQISTGTITGSALDTTSPITFSNAYASGGEPTKANVDLQFVNNNFTSTVDTITFGSTTLTFGTDITIGADLAETLENTANAFNAITTGDESNYSFATNGSDTLSVTRNQAGDIDTVGNNLGIETSLSGASQTVTVGSDLATTTANTTLKDSGNEGSDPTYESDANTTPTSTLVGAISDVSVTLNSGSAIGATDFNPNTISITLTVGGETYTSDAIELEGGSIDGNSDGDGDNAIGQDGFGNLLRGGTSIRFTKDSDSDTTAGTEDVTFSLVLGSSDVTIDAQGDADTLESDIQSFLDDSSVLIGQDFNPSLTESDLITSGPVSGFRTGTFSLGDASITLDAGDSLQELRSKINAVSETSGLTAEIIQVSDNSFSLTLKANDEGIANAISEYGEVTAGRIQIGADQVALNEDQAASNASFDLNGTTITRSTNTIDDVLDDITFTLLTDTNTTTITANIEPDSSIIKNGVIDLLNTYNDFKFFIAEQLETDAEGNPVEGAVLGNESSLTTILQDINEEVNRTVSGIVSSSADTLFEIGIDFVDFPGSAETPATENIFTLDETTFDAKFEANFDDIRRLFSFDFVADSPEISVFDRNNSVSLSDFQLDVDTSRTSDEVRVLDSEGDYLFNMEFEPVLDQFGIARLDQGGKFVGASGTALSGLELVYSGDGSDNINVSLTQGIADRIYNDLDSILDKDTGVLASEVNGLNDANERLDDNIDRDTVQLERERDLLIARFAQVEAIISQLNSVLRFFEAEQAAQRNS